MSGIAWRSVKAMRNQELADDASAFDAVRVEMYSFEAGNLRGELLVRDGCLAGVALGDGSATWIGVDRSECPARMIERGLGNTPQPGLRRAPGPTYFPEDL